MKIDRQRQAEVNKYSECYQDPNYRMGGPRMVEAKNFVSEWQPGSVLDVGCGRAEMLDYFKSRHFMAHGLEGVPELALREDVTLGSALCLPWTDKAFDYVTSWDVLEHLLPGDERLLLSEMLRVAKVAVAFTANNKPSFHNGVDLHVNRRPYPEWDNMVREVFDGWTIRTQAGYSQLWECVR